MSVSVRTLKLLAAGVWYTGSVALLIKGSSLLLQASDLEPEENWPWLAASAALAAGIAKALVLFNRSCRKNLDRIASLEGPRIWQFFRPGFLVLLGTMIATGATLSQLADGNYSFLIGLAFLDLSIGVALLVSSLVFWRRRIWVKTTA